LNGRQKQFHSHYRQDIALERVRWSEMTRAYNQYDSNPWLKGHYPAVRSATY